MANLSDLEVFRAIMEKKIKKFDTRLENSFFAYQNSFFNLSKLVFRLSKLVFRLSKLVFRLSKLVFRPIIYRITNKTNTSNNTKIVLASQKRHIRAADATQQG
jgi:hypothetical protein